MFLRLSNITNKSICLISKAGRAPAARTGGIEGSRQRSLDWVEYIQNIAEKKKRGETEKVWAAKQGQTAVGGKKGKETRQQTEEKPREKNDFIINFSVLGFSQRGLCIKRGTATAGPKRRLLGDVSTTLNKLRCNKSSEGGEEGRGKQFRPHAELLH